jgi:hypothetical protein
LFRRGTGSACCRRNPKGRFRRRQFGKISGRAIRDDGIIVRIIRGHCFDLDQSGRGTDATGPNKSGDVTIDAEDQASDRKLKSE